MATTLFSPILNDKTRAPYFFNGRLLSGEAMTDEQRAQKVARELLAEAVGDGVVYGLTFELKTGGDVSNPIVTVKSGVAINRCGEILLLANDTDVQLVRPTHVATPPATIFGVCKPPIADVSCVSDFQALLPPQSGTYVADDGVYLLTICSIGAGEGLATVSGLGNTPTGCNIKYVVDAVEFRLLELPVDSSIRTDTAHLRNWVAYHCFGVDDMLDYATDPFGADADSEPHTLLDDIRGTQLTDCDVPLGVMYWTATGGVQFVDLWSVRRRVAHTRASSLHAAFSDRRKATEEATFLQFQAHLTDLMSGSPQPTSLVATDYFARMPPLGFLPLADSSGRPGVAYSKFLTGRTYRQPVFVNAAKVQPLLRNFISTASIDFRNDEMIWLYLVVQNMRGVNAGGSSAPQTFVIFATGQIPYQADSQFDVSYWNYSNYS